MNSYQDEVEISLNCFFREGVKKSIFGGGISLLPLDGKKNVANAMGQIVCNKYYVTKVM